MQFKASVCSRSSADIEDSDPADTMDDCLLSLFCAVYVVACAKNWPLFKGVLQRVSVSDFVWSINLNNEAARLELSCYATKKYVIKTLASGHVDFRVYVRVDGRVGWFVCVLAFVVILP
jgi:hypothetical protein